VQAAGAVGDRLDRHPVLVGEDAADPDVRGELVLRQPDPLADEVARLADARGLGHVDAAVPEQPGREDRDGDERRLAGQPDDVAGQRHLRGVELAEAGHAEERLLHLLGQVGQVDAGGPDAAVPEGLRPVVPFAGQGDRNAHVRSSRWFWVARATVTDIGID
jgi:hypothetical protein